jgi:hypothetical protein
MTWFIPSTKLWSPSIGTPSAFDQQAVSKKFRNFEDLRRISKRMSLAVPIGRSNWTIF